MLVPMGLPPLAYNAAIARAAQNHADYLQQNKGALTHEETPGRPGFTGTFPFFRCQAVGAVCHGEVATGGNPWPDPVLFWLAAP
jgi:hypothetical protein